MLNRNTSTMLKVTAVGLFTLFSIGNAISASKIDSAISIENKITKTSARSQVKVDSFAEQTSDMLTEYTALLKLIDMRQNHNRSLSSHIGQQEAEMQSLQDDIDGMDETQRAIIPLMDEMIVSLDSFVNLDIPFYLEKRNKLITKLKNTMIRADVQVAEKYRLILAAYEREIAYGNGFDSYVDSIETDTGPMEVEFLRFGRLLLVYLTLDSKSAGYWNVDSGSFEPLDDEYLRSIANGIKMANGQTSNTLIKLPVNAAK